MNLCFIRGDLSSRLCDVVAQRGWWVDSVLEMDPVTVREIIADTWPCNVVSCERVSCRTLHVCGDGNQGVFLSALWGNCVWAQQEAAFEGQAAWRKSHWRKLTSGLLLMLFWETNHPLLWLIVLVLVLRADTTPMSFPRERRLPQPAASSTI